MEIENTATQNSLKDSAEALLDQLRCLSEEAFKKLRQECSQFKQFNQEEASLWLIDRATQMIDEIKQTGEGWLLSWKATPAQCQEQVQKIFKLMKNFDQNSFNAMMNSMRELRRQHSSSQIQIQSLQITIIQDLFNNRFQNQPAALKQRLKRVITIYSILKYTPYKKPEKVQEHVESQQDQYLCHSNYYDVVFSIKSRQKAINNILDAEDISVLEILTESFPSFLKLIALYELCIITKQEVIAQIPERVFSEEYYSRLVSLLSARQNSRLKSNVNVFKPTQDQDHNTSYRVTPCYVVNQLPNCPRSHPHPIINRTLISVAPPNHQSLTRPPNNFQRVLWRVQDQMQTVQNCRLRLEKAISIIQAIVKKHESQTKDIYQLVKSMLSLRIIQFIYYKATPEEKHEMETLLQNHPKEICQTFGFRAIEQLSKMKMATKQKQDSWRNHISMNINYAGNYRGFKVQQAEIKASDMHYYLKELKGMIPQVLSSLGKVKVINSFQNIIPGQACISHPDIQISLPSNPNALPVYLMSFANTQIRRIVYHSIINCLQEAQSHKSIQMFLRLISNILQWKQQSTFQSIKDEIRGDAFQMQQESIQKQMSSMGLSQSSSTISTIPPQILHLIRLLFTIYQRILRTTQVLLPGGSNAISSILSQCFSQPSTHYYTKIQDLFGYLKAKPEYASLSCIAFGIRKLIKIFASALLKVNRNSFEKVENSAGEVVELTVRRGDGVLMVGVYGVGQIVQLQPLGK